MSGEDYPIPLREELEAWRSTMTGEARYFREEAIDILARLTRFILAAHDRLSLVELKTLGAGAEMLSAVIDRLDADD